MYIIPQRSDINKFLSDLMCWSDTTYIIPDRSDISKFWCDIMRRNDITYIVPGWCDISYITPHRCHVPQKTSMGFEPGTP